MMNRGGVIQKRRVRATMRRKESDKAGVLVWSSWEVSLLSGTGSRIVMGSTDTSLSDRAEDEKGRSARVKAQAMSGRRQLPGLRAVRRHLVCVAAESEVISGFEVCQTEGSGGDTKRIVGHGAFVRGKGEEI